MLELREMHGYCTTRRSLCFAAIYAAMLLFGNAECAAAAFPVNPSDADCDAAASCSPAACANVDNEPCTFTDPDIDWPLLLNSVSCRQCTVSSDARCTNESLTEVFGQGAAGGGETSVRAAYCTDEFLVVWSAGQPQHVSSLDGVPRPPGGGGGSGGYDSECVTRSTTGQSQAYKIPLTPVPLASSRQTWDPYPPAGATGVTVTGIPTYPGLDNRGLWLWDACEADKCNAHVGRGADYHYHGDPMGDDCLYVASDLVDGDPHTKLIAYALDGYPVYARYVEAGAPGEDVDLDSCGGHDHDDYGYHYHPHVGQRTPADNLAGTAAYTAYYIAPTTCFAGDVDVVDNFYADADKPYNADEEDSGQPNYDNSLAQRRYDPSSRSDYEQLRPCCSMALDGYFAVDGVELDKTGDTGADGTTGTDLKSAAVRRTSGYATLAALVATAVLNTRHR